MRFVCINNIYVYVFVMGLDLLAMKGMSNRTPLKQHRDVASSSDFMNSFFSSSYLLGSATKLKARFMFRSGSYTHATVICPTLQSSPSVSMSNASIVLCGQVCWSWRILFYTIVQLRNLLSHV
jgi:hypothetical protein